MALNEPITAERAAELTAQCTEVDFDWRKKEHTARLWRNSKYHYGSGATVLEAVLNAHKEADSST